jgi:competence protein ComEC
MLKLVLLFFCLWIAIFGFRVYQIGGLSSNFKETDTSIFQPLTDSFNQIISHSLPQPQSSILSAMVIGDQKGIAQSFKKDLQSTSTIHLLVVSGQNLSILAGFLMNLVYVFGRRKTATLTLLAIIFYSLLTGLGVPVIRAALMAGCGLMAQILGRDIKSWWILVFTGSVMLLINPNWLISISFQLSFLATLGVIVVAPVLSNYLGYIPKIVRGDLAVTIAAYFLTLPIIVYNFHQLSVVGILTNILVLWTAPLIMISGVVTILVGTVSQTLSIIVGIVPTILITYFIYIVEFFAKFTSPVILIGQTSLLFWLGYYLFLTAGLVYLHIHSLTDSIEKRDGFLIKSIPEANSTMG